MDDAAAAIWIVAVGLGAFALLLGAGLLLLRVWRFRSESRNSALKRRLQAEFLSLVDDPDEIVKFAATWRRQRRLLGKIAAQVLNSVSGDVQHRVVGLATALGLHKQFKRTALAGSRLERLDAIEALQHFPAAITTLRLATRDDDANVRTAAARGLAAIGWPLPLPAVCRVVHRDGGWSSILRTLLADAVAYPTAQLLAAALDRRQPPALRVLIAEAVAGRGDPYAESGILALCGADLPGLRVAGLQLLAATPAGECAAIIFAFLHDADEHVRVAAVHAAAADPTLELTRRLMAMEDDPSWEVRIAVTRALTRLAEIDVATLKQIAGSQRPEAPPAPAALARRNVS